MVKVTYPGHKYLGPGNNLEEGEPVNNADLYARKHDHAYHLAKNKQDIYKSDLKAINKFRGDWKEKFNFPSFFGDLGLSAKHFVESSLDTVFYPQMPPIQPQNYPENPHQRKNARQPLKAHGKSVMSASDGLIEGGESGTCEAAQASAETGDPGDLGGGQTTYIFSGSTQEPTWYYKEYEKTYRFTFKSTLPACKLSEGLPVFRIGSAVRLPVEYLASYLSLHEMARLTVFETVQVVNAACEIYSYGIRLPFVTGESASVTANASAQYPLCEWKGLENDYDLYQTEDEVSDTILKMNGTFQLPTTSDWSENFTNLTARATSREIQSEAQLILPIVNAAATSNRSWYPPTNEYAHTMNGTVNLGKVFNWNYKPKMGLLSQGHSLSNAYAAPTAEGFDAQAEPTTSKFEIGETNPVSIDTPNLKKRIFRGLNNYNGTNQENLSRDQAQFLIDGWPYFGGNSNQMPNIKITPFIVGMQFLRNSDDSILVADWEFAATFKCTIRMRDGTRGLGPYGPTYEPYYMGLNPVQTLGVDAQDVQWWPQNRITNRGVNTYKDLIFNPTMEEEKKKKQTKLNYVKKIE